MIFLCFEQPNSKIKVSNSHILLANIFGLFLFLIINIYNIINRLVPHKNKTLSPFKLGSPLPVHIEIRNVVRRYAVSYNGDEEMNVLPNFPCTMTTSLLYAL